MKKALKSIGAGTTIVLLTACSNSNKINPPKSPNVLIILADDLGFSDLGCYGGEIKTPNLDKLASGGLRFTHFYNCGRCWPSRASILTGYYPQQVGRDSGPGIDGGSRGERPNWAGLLPRYLKNVGYRSYHSGKWHIDGMPLDNDFDHSFYILDQDRHFSPKNLFEDDKKLPPVLKDFGFYSTTEIAEKAIAQLKYHNKNYSGTPFFSYVAFTAPHFPLQAMPADIKRVGDRYAPGWEKMRKKRWERIKESGIVSEGELSKIERQIGPPYFFPDAYEILGSAEVNRPIPWDSLTPEQKHFQQDKMTIHAAMVERMDIEIGRIFDQLKRIDAIDNTLIIFLSDNGASSEIMVRGDGQDRKATPGSANSYLCLGPGWANMCNTPFRRYKTSDYEGGICTPFIVSFPKDIKAHGEFRQAQAHVIDIVPTILDLAGASITNQVPFPGKSLVSTFTNDTIWQHSLWWYHEGNRAFREGNWKIVAAKDEEWELYNFNVDRTESHNLANDNQERVSEMGNRWNKMLDEIRDVPAQQKSGKKNVSATTNILRSKY